MTDYVAQARAARERLLKGEAPKQTGDATTALDDFGDSAPGNLLFRAGGVPVRDERVAPAPAATKSDGGAGGNLREDLSLDEWRAAHKAQYGDSIPGRKMPRVPLVSPITDAAGYALRAIPGMSEYLDGNNAWTRAGEWMTARMPTGRSLAAGAAQNLIYYPGGGLPMLGLEGAAGTVGEGDGFNWDALGSVEYGVGKTIAPANYPPGEADKIYQDVENWKKFGGGEGKMTYGEAVELMEGKTAAARDKLAKLKESDPKFAEKWEMIKQYVHDHAAYEQAQGNRRLQAGMSVLSPGKVAAILTASGAFAGAMRAGDDATPDEAEGSTQLGGAAGILALLGGKGMWRKGAEIIKGSPPKPPDDTTVSRVFEGNDMAKKEMPGVGTAAANQQYANALTRALPTMREGQRKKIAGKIDDATRIIGDDVSRQMDDSAGVLKYGAAAPAADAAQWKGMSAEVGKQRDAMETAVRRDIYAELDEGVMSGDKEIGGGVYVKTMKDNLAEALNDYQGFRLSPLMELSRRLKARGGVLRGADKAAFEADKAAAIEKAAQDARAAYRNSEDGQKLADLGDEASKKQLEANAEKAAKRAMKAAEKQMDSGQVALVRDIINARSQIQKMRLPPGVEGKVREEIIGVLDDSLRGAMGDENFKMWETARAKWRDIYEIFDDKALGGLAGLQKGGSVSDVRKNWIKLNDDHDKAREMFLGLARAVGKGDVKAGAPRAASFLVGAMNDKEAVRMFTNMKGGALFPGAEGTDDLMNALGKRAMQSFLSFSKQAAKGDTGALDMLDGMKPEDIKAIRNAAVKRGSDPAMVDKTMQTAYLQAKFRDAIEVAKRGGKASADDLNVALSKNLHELLGTHDKQASRRFDAIFAAKPGDKITPRLRFEVQAAMLDGLRYIKQGEQAVDPFARSELSKNAKEIAQITLTGLRPLYYPISTAAVGTQLGARVAKAVLDGQRHDYIVAAMVRKGIGGDKTVLRKLDRFIEAALENRKDAGALFRRWYLSEAQSDATVKEILEGKGNDEGEKE